MLTTKRIGSLVIFRISASKCRRRFRILKRIDHHYAVVADHESGIAAGFSLVVHDRGPYAVADLLQREVARRT